MSTAIASSPVRRRSGGMTRSAGRAARRLAAAELAALCDICGGRREGGEVLVEGWTYCSIECAHIARDRTPPGQYFG
ncbi:MAG: hypothetical protein E6J30_09905 [Chloroflexi bacterium]|nr:MAG: hypothetical protein E6J30_09905 [Chloroflexota bacterium]